MKSLKAKIVSTSISIAFAATLVGLGISSFAWYSENKDTAATGLNVSVNVDSNMVDFNFKLYKYDQDIKEGIEYNEGSTGFNLDLNDFDNFIRERNVYNNNVIRFHVYFPNYLATTGSARKVTIKANIEETTIGDRFDGGFTDTSTRTYADTLGYQYNKAVTGGSEKYICNNISNIIYFKGFMYSYKMEDETTHYVDPNITIDESTADSTYKTATEAFQSFDEHKFITGSVKDGSLELDLDEIDIKSTEAVFYIEYNYDIDLVDTFLNDTEIVGSQDVSMMSSRITFMKDVKNINISAEEVK